MTEELKIWRRSKMSSKRKKVNVEFRRRNGIRETFFDLILGDTGEGVIKS